MRWTKEMDNLLLYMRDCLNISNVWCAEIIKREFRVRPTKNACIGRYRRAKNRGFQYVPVESDGLND